MRFFSDLLTYPFLQYAVVAAFLSSIASGVVGSITVVRRSTYVAGAVSHCVLGGMGAAGFFRTVYDIRWLTPMIGALVAAIAAACVIAWATVYVRERLDSVLSVVWALGMAIGITFIMKTPGYGQDLMSYLFGSILMISGRDLVLMLILDGIIAGGVLLLYHPILAVCFHEEAARVRGIPVGLITLIILLLTALTTVLLVQLVGVVLVIALLSIPAGTAARFTSRLSTMMVLAAGLCLFFSLGGLALSYGPELPVGATIIELAGLCYLGTLIWRRRS